MVLQTIHDTGLGKPVIQLLVCGRAPAHPVSSHQFKETTFRVFCNLVYKIGYLGTMLIVWNWCGGVPKNVLKLWQRHFHPNFPYFRPKGQRAC